MRASAWIWGEQISARCAWAEADDLDINETGFEAGGANIGFGKGFLAFGIDEPKRGGVVHGLGKRRDTFEVFLLVDKQKDGWRIFGCFSCSDVSSLFFEAGEEVGGKIADERDGFAGLDAELIEDGFGVDDFFAPLSGLRAEFEDERAVFGVDVEFAADCFDVCDGSKGDLDASIAAEQDFGSFQQGFAGKRFPCMTKGAEQFVSHPALA